MTIQYKWSVCNNSCFVDVYLCYCKFSKCLCRNSHRSIVSPDIGLCYSSDFAVTEDSPKSLVLQIYHYLHYYYNAIHENEIF